MPHPLIPLIKNKSMFISLAEEFDTPLYFYDENQFTKNIITINNALSKNFQKFHICYTIKANSNPSIIKKMKSVIPNLGADCSSPGDLYAAQLGGISTTECIFTGNYESEDDLKTALNSGAHINLDDITSFHRLKKIGMPKEISFRLNPGFGKGAFKQIVTGGKNSKFGIPKDSIIDAYRLAKNNGIRKFGIQCMTGSGILDIKYFTLLMQEILKTVDLITKKLKIQFNHISIGGGYGIPYRSNEGTLNFNKMFKNISSVFYSYFKQQHKPELWIEPGRSIIGNAGILISKVTGIKKSYKNFIGLDAGMETLIRPALYNSYHKIYKIGDPDATPIQTIDFTGRICENTDRLAIDRPFPKIEEGELVAIMDAGAYGFSMSNQFCNRPRAAEVLFDGKRSSLIRKRETIENIFYKCIEKN